MEAELLQTVEHLLEDMQRLGVVATTVVTAMQRGELLPDTILADYAAQLAQVDEQRTRLWQTVAATWQMIGSDGAH